MLAVDETIILQFIGTLKEILPLELKAGNRICETYRGDWSGLYNEMIIKVWKANKYRLRLLL